MKNNDKIYVVKSLIDFNKVFNAKIGSGGGPNNTSGKLISFKRYNFQERNKERRYIEKYGENYKEIIQKKWDMRKLNRKLKNKLPEKGFVNKKGKI